MQDKYPESSSFIQRIQAVGARVAHKVNACDCRPPSLPAFVSTGIPYHHIIFHHPHVGQESLLMHQAFLGHFFGEVTQHGLLGLDGVLHVSLGGCQPRDWLLLPQAARHGLYLVLQTV
jgi:hypothetical protein